MADKSIGELIAATQITESDLFVLEQSGTAKKMTGQIFVNWLTHYADGHGGIQSITKTTTAGLVDTYRITFADTDAVTFTVTNGKGISSITQYWAVSSSNSTVPSSWQTTRQTMTTTNRYLWSYMRIAYNDGSNTDTTKSVVGVYGDTGAQTYVWIKYAAIEPTSDADMGDNPDNWIGIYYGTASSAPTSRTSYTWYKYKGEKGDTGAPATLDTSSVSYQQSESGTVVPSGSWTPSVPNARNGWFLWTRVILRFNTGNQITYYSVSRYGIDGTGAVSTVNNISPDQNGNIALDADDIAFSGDGRSIENHIESINTKIGTDTLETSSSTIIGAINEVKESNDKQELYVELTYNGVETNYYIDEVTSDYVVSQATVDDPSFQVGDWTLTTSNGYITIFGPATEPTVLKLLLTKPTFTSIASYETEENPPAHSSGTSRGKVISILGDSISTYQGYIPEGHDAHYTPSNLGSVNDTWWMKVINALGASLGINESWGNSRVTTTREGAPESMAACSTERTSNLGNPDIIIIWIGINDFNHEVDLGTYDGTGAFPTTTTTFREAYSIMLYRIMKNYPHADVYCCTLPPCEHNGTAIYPPEVNENGVTLNSFNNAIRDLSGMFGAQLLDIARAGITHENLQYYMQDWGATSKSGLHPNANGFSRVANYMIKHIDPACRVRYPFHTST